MCTQPEHITIKMTYLNDYEVEIIDDKLIDAELEENDIEVILI